MEYDVEIVKMANAKIDKRYKINHDVGYNTQIKSIVPTLSETTSQCFLRKKS